MINRTNLASYAGLSGEIKKRKNSLLFILNKKKK